MKMKELGWFYGVQLAYIPLQNAGEWADGSLAIPVAPFTNMV